MGRKSLSDAGVANLKPRAKRYFEPDPELRGHYICVEPTAAKSFYAITRNPAGKQIWTKIGPVGVLRIAEAREQARQLIQRVRMGLPAFEPRAESFRAVADNWVRRHVKAKGLRSRYDIERVLAKHVFPAWGDREFTSIRRSDIAALLDKVEDESGARQADIVLAVVRGIMNWSPPDTTTTHRRSCAACGGRTRRRASAIAFSTMTRSARFGASPVKVAGSAT